MRSLVRSRFWLLFLVFVVTASEDGTKASTSATTVESSSIDPTTDLTSSASTSEESTIASTTVLSSVGTTAQVKRPDCSGFDRHTTKDFYMVCKSAQMKMKSDGKNFEVADFSKFTQQEIELMLQVKNPTGEIVARAREFLGNFIADGSDITDIANISFSSDTESQSFVLKNNLNLENVNLESSETTKFLILTISGNKKLSDESLNHLKALVFKNDSLSYIQDFGECDFDNGTLAKTSQLGGCHYIRGDLLIKKTTDIDDTRAEELKNVTGCIKIIGTEITNLTLLDNIKVTTCSGPNAIKDNNKLCLHPGEINALKTYFEEMKDSDGKSLGQTVEYENNMPCKGECNSTYLKNSKDKTCIIITDNLKIEGKEAEDVSHLEQIEEIRGSLYIVRTTLKNVTLFPSLTTIVFNRSDSDRAIFIQENKEMEYFDFPQLTTVILAKNRNVKAAAFVMEENGNYTMDKDQAEKLSNITQTDIEKFPVPIPYEEYANYTGNGTESVRRSRKNETETPEPEAQITDQTGGIVGGVVGGIIVLAVVLALTIFFIVRCQKKKKKEERQNKMIEGVKLRVRIKIDDTSSMATALKDVEDKCDTVRVAVPEEQQKGTKTMRMRESGHYCHGAFSEFWKDWESQFRKQQRLNFDAGNIFGMEQILIKRDNIDFDVAAKLEAETMKYTNTVWVQNPEYSLYGIRPRQEITKEIWYDHGDGPFNPEAFIQACMKSSAVTLKYRTMMAALEYVLKNQRFGNPYDANAPPKQLVEVTGPVHIVGDTHGSLMDLQMIFSLDPEKAIERHNIHPMLYYKYVFTGDYLDRGIYDTALFAFLTVFATLFPTKVFLLRGNHDWGEELDEHSCTAHCRENWNLREGIEIRKKMLEVTCWLPIAARVNKRILAVHGGITQYSKLFNESTTLEQAFDVIPMPLCGSVRVDEDYKAESCFKDWPQEKINMTVLAVEHLLWSDPAFHNNQGNSRMAGGFFNKATVDDWCNKFGLDLIVRGHQDIGFYYSFNGRLITIFGSFDTVGSRIGVPYAFCDHPKYREPFADHCETVKGNPSTAVLRITSDNTLHFLMMRHVYEGDDTKPTPLNIRKAATEYTLANPDADWQAEMDKKDDDTERNKLKYGQTTEAEIQAMKDARKKAREEAAAKAAAAASQGAKPEEAGSSQVSGQGVQMTKEQQKPGSKDGPKESNAKNEAATAKPQTK